MTAIVQIVNTELGIATPEIEIPPKTCMVETDSIAQCKIKVGDKFEFRVKEKKDGQG